MLHDGQRSNEVSAREQSDRCIDELPRSSIGIVAPDVTSVILAGARGPARGPMESLHAKGRIAAKATGMWAMRMCRPLVKANERKTSPVSATAFVAHDWRCH